MWDNVVFVLDSEDPVMSGTYMTLTSIRDILVHDWNSSDVHMGPNRVPQNGKNVTLQVHIIDNHGSLTTINGSYMTHRSTNDTVVHDWNSSDMYIHLNEVPQNGILVTLQVHLWTVTGHSRLSMSHV